ncbi:MAG: 4Fe-4S dicluster domain-containing protein, partial [bacterium]|nr:4Fe-4S dicluster domain-containing protein [bacterium]
EIPALILEVARLLVEVHGLSIPEAMLESAQTNLSALPQRSSVFAENVAVDLAEHEGEGVILVGPQQPATVHILAAAINQAVGSQGSTLRYVQEPWTDRQVGLTELGELVDLINSGEVQSLILLGGNPVYDGPRDLGLISLLEQVPFTVHLSLYRNETSKLCSWHLPRAHTLESWGDGTAWDGTWTCAQPLIAPLYGGKTSAELIALLLGDGPQTGHEIVRETFSQRFAELSFESGLHDGLIANSEFVEVDPPEFRTNADQVGAELSDLVAGSSNNAGIIEVVFRPDSKVFDGRFANSGWLQELPDSFTKVTWGNAALMSPQTARDLNLSDGEVIAISVGDQSVEIPTYVLPGHAPQCVSVSLGYGRTEAGEVGNGVGSNVYPLRTLQGMSHTRASVTGTGRHFQLATTQSHHAIDTQGFEARRGRIANLVREATLDEYLAHPDVIHHHDHHPPLVSLWKDQQYEGEQWGIAIDLSTCMGCSACVVACQAENNIPVVGREQVLNQREMHWLRVDRYFKTDEALTAEQVEDAEVSFQPVACVQCEMAPCEQVCPVAATQHTRDGLNAMVYNRCVGTRYCANNCPYKVRRFNFFNYRKDIPEIEQMQLNPEVTVRSRGVMEKCTYCVQRIEAVRISATNDRRPIRDGEITPACAQTCPTDAIVFGDLNDPDSEVSRLRQDQRSYATLAELNIRPRTHYLARIRNPRDDSSHSDGKESA